jgi:hypothetical protein
MALNEFRGESRDQIAKNLASEIKMKLSEVDPRLGIYVQNGKLMIPIADLLSAKVSVTLSASGGKKIIGLSLTF